MKKTLCKWYFGFYNLPLVVMEAANPINFAIPPTLRPYIGWAPLDRRDPSEDDSKESLIEVFNEKVVERCHQDYLTLASIHIPTQPERFCDLTRKIANNRVIRICGATECFFKSGRAVGIMETLAWQMGNILGLGQYFTPTEFRKISVGKQDFEGSLQPAQEGILAEKWFYRERLEKDFPRPEERLNHMFTLNLMPQNFQCFQRMQVDLPSLSRIEVALGITVMLIKGSTDSHLGNFLFDSDGKFKTFDHTQDFPNGNAIYGKKGFQIACRPSYLFFSETLENLDDEEAKQIENLIKTAHSSQHNLARFLHSDLVQSKLNELPKGWVYVDEMLASLEERLEYMLQFIESRKGKNFNMRDLVFASNPVLKFISSLNLILQSQEQIDQILQEKDHHESLRWRLRKTWNVQAVPLEELFVLAQEKNVDLTKILAICEKNENYDDICIETASYLQLIRSEEASFDEYIERLHSNEGIILELFDKAVLDLKDISQEKIEGWCKSVEAEILFIRSYGDLTPSPYFSTLFAELRHKYYLRYIKDKDFFDEAAKRNMTLKVGSSVPFEGHFFYWDRLDKSYKLYIYAGEDLNVFTISLEPGGQVKVHKPMPPLPSSQREPFFSQSDSPPSIAAHPYGEYRKILSIEKFFEKIRSYSKDNPIFSLQSPTLFSPQKALSPLGVMPSFELMSPPEASPLNRDIHPINEE